MRNIRSITISSSYLLALFVLAPLLFASSTFAAPAGGVISKASPISGSISIPPNVWTTVTPSFSASCGDGVSLVGAITPDLSHYILALVKDGRETNVEAALTAPSGQEAAKLIKREGKKSLLSLGWISPSGFVLVGTGKTFLKELANALAGKTPNTNRAFEIVSASSFFPANTSALITTNNVLKTEGKSVAVATGIHVVGATAGQAPGNQFMGLICRNAAAVYYPPVGVAYTEGASNMAQVRSEFENSKLLSTEKVINAIVLADDKAK